jgi:hypothetical protein
MVHSNQSAFLEDPRGILYTFGSSSWDFVHFWKFLISFCAFLEVPHGILCIFGISSWQSIHNKCEKSYIKMIWLSPNEGHLRQTNVTIHLLRINLDRVTRILMIYLRVPHGIVYILEVPHGILCIFGSSSYHFVHFWKFLMGFYAVLEFKNAQNPMIDFE